MGEWSAGTVRKARGKWQGVLSRGDGKKREQRTKLFDIASEPGTNKGRPAALKALAEWRAELVAEESAPTLPKASTQTVGEYCNSYVSDLKARGVIEASTVRDYLHMVKYLTRGEHPIAAIKMADLRPSHIERWETSLLAGEGLSAATVKKAHRVLRQCMRHAVEVEDLVRDPTASVKAPKAAARQPNALDAAARARLVKTLDAMAPTPLRTGAALALYTGMREGEVCGLRWKNVDLKGGTLWVRESIGCGAGGTYVKEPKTGGSRRDIPLPSPLTSMLAERRASMINECLDAGVPFTGELFVLGRIDGAYQDPTALGKQWQSMAASYGFVGVTGRRVTFHDLRHTFATAAIAQGVDVKTVSSILGHANAAMTLNIYASADPDAKRRAADAVAEAMAAPVRMAEVIEFPTGTEGR